MTDKAKTYAELKDEASKEAGHDMSYKEIAKEKAIAEVKAILKKHDIRMSVDGCGCCDSPSVDFKYKGKWVLKFEGCVNFDMFDDKDRYSAAVCAIIKEIEEAEQDRMQRAKDRRV